MTEKMLPTNTFASRYELGIDAMDATHREFLDLYRQLVDCGPERFGALFTALANHTRAHFAAEDALMLAYGFPATREHSGEHQRVLGELARFSEQIAVGRMLMARAWINEQILDWFEVHLHTMDSALAAHLKHACATQKTSGRVTQAT